MIRDTTKGYGLVSRLLHWAMALAIFGLFGLGLWMSDLDYYSPYYHSAPDLHKSIGMVVLLALVARVLWRALNVRPRSDELSRIERVAARAVHLGLYAMLFVLITAGYLLATADGRSVDVFGLVSIPSIIHDKSLEDPAGFVHAVLAWIVIVIALIHAGAALKHHFWDRTHVLRRMWSGPAKSVS